jgi:hypothetical protein
LQAANYANCAGGVREIRATLRQILPKEARIFGHGILHRDPGAAGGRNQRLVPWSSWHAAQSAAPAAAQIKKALRFAQGGSGEPPYEKIPKWRLNILLILSRK